MTLTEARASQTPDPAHRVIVERSPRWVRVRFADVTIADSKNVLLMLETGNLPVYYFPPHDVRRDLLRPTDHRTEDPYKGVASYWTIRVGDRVAENAVWSYLAPPPTLSEVKGYLAFAWNAVDAWFEEEEQIFAHPRDPYHRVDALPSSRHVRIVLAGEPVAETRRPHLLFETNHPTRYYIPQEDVRMDLLEPSERHTRCPYKGEASYWNARIGDEVFPDIVWSYLDPLPECPKIRGLLAFFNERVDTYVDGELQPRPKTRWS